MKIRVPILLVFINLFFISCIQPKYGIDAYDKKKDCTNYYLISYGGIIIPGKWNKIRYGKMSKQKFNIRRDISYLISPDSSKIISITSQNPNDYQLKINQQTNAYKFLKAVYNSEENYLAKNIDAKSEIIKTDSISNYIISKVMGAQATTHVSLLGLRRSRVIEIVIITNDWDINKKVNFVSGIYLNN